jgi:hypothetical protein
MMTGRWPRANAILIRGGGLLSADGRLGREI